MDPQQLSAKGDADDVSSRSSASETDDAVRTSVVLETSDVFCPPAPATVDISVIMPVYDNEDFLSSSLDSFFNQTIAARCEILCIDDGSEDASYELLRRIEQQHPGRMRVFTQENQGAGAARNVGLQEARGRFIYFLDADDLIPSPKTLEHLLDAVTEHKARIAGGSFQLYDGKDYRTDFSDEEYLQKYTFCQEGMMSYEDYQFEYGYQRFLFSSAMLAEHGITFPPYRRYQDPPFLVRAMLAAGSFYALCEVTYLYRALSHFTWTSEKVCDMIRGLRDVVVCARDHGLSELMYGGIKRLLTEWNGIIGNEIITEHNKEVLLVYCAAVHEFKTTIDDVACRELLDKTPAVLDELLGIPAALREAQGIVQDQLRLLESRDGRIAELQEATTKLHEEIAVKDRAIEVLQHDVVQRSQDIAVRDAEIARIYASSTWKAGRLVTAVPRRAKKIAGGSCRNDAPPPQEQ